MSTFTDRLAIIIDADGKGAIREFEKVDAASGKALAATDDKLAKVSGGLRTFGLGAVTAGALVTGGLYKIAQGAQQVADSADAATGTFGAAFAEVDKFARGAADKLGLSRGEALKMATAFGTIGKSAGVSGAELAKFGESLTERTRDLAEFFGKDISEVQDAVTSGIKGRGKALRDYGVVLDDAALKEYAYSNGIAVSGAALTTQQKTMAAYGVILDQTKDKAGFFTQQQGDMGASADKLKANFQNMADDIGAAAIPVFDKIISAVGSTASAFNGLPGPLKETVGQFGAIGGVGAVAVGALSLVVGQVDKARDLFDKFGRDGEGNMNRVGKAAVALGKVFAVVGISDMVFGLINDFNDLDTQTEIALNNFKSNVGGSADDVVGSFNEMVKAKDDALALSHIWTDFGNTFYLAGQGVERSAADMKDAFDAMFKSEGPEKAQKLVDSLRDINEQSDHTNRNYSATNTLLDEWQVRIDAATGAQGALTAETKANTKATGENADATDEATSAIKDYTNQVKAATDPVFAVVDAQRKLADAHGDVAQAQDELTKAVKEHGPASAEALTATQKLQDAQRDSVLAALDLNGAFGTLAGELEKNPQLLDAVSGALDDLKRQYPELGGAIDAIKGKAFEAAKGMQDFAGDYKVNVTANFDNFYAQLNKARAISRQFSLGGNSPGQNNADRQGAVGAVVAAGETLLVGENGPEIFQAGSSGYIVPNNRLGGSPSWAGNTQTGDTYTFNVNMVAGDKASIDRMIADSLTRYSRNGGVVRANVVAV